MTANHIARIPAQNILMPEAGDGLIRRQRSSNPAANPVNRILLRAVAALPVSPPLIIADARRSAFDWKHKNSGSGGRMRLKR